jgi:ABC-type sugar transport system permease subunit
VDAKQMMLQFRSYAKLDGAAKSIVKEYKRQYNTQKVLEVVKIVDKAIKQKKTPVYVIEQAQALLNDTQPAIVANIKTVFNSNDNMWRYFTNTLIMWILGFVPQILISLLLAVWFTNTELRLKGQQFFKTVIYIVVKNYLRK